MRVLASMALVLLLTTGSAWAQRGGSRGGGMRGGFGGGGVRVRVGGGFHRGFGGHAVARHRAFFNRSNKFFFNRGFHKGFGFKGFGFRRGFGFDRGFGFGGGLVVPYSYVLPAYPDYSYVSPYSLAYPYASPYGSPYSLGYPADVTAVTPPPAYTSPAPGVVINQQFASPVIRDSSPLVYEPPARPPPPASQAPEDRSAAIYLIALKQSNTIRPALAFWVDNGTLHYVGLDRKQMQVPLSAVNRDLSLQLNRERNVPFRLPDAP